MRVQKRTFLLSKALKIPFKDPIGVYDPKLQINVVSMSDSTPLISLAGAPPTHSKTLAAPGDDDPERGQDPCY